MNPVGISVRLVKLKSISSIFSRLEKAPKKYRDQLFDSLVSVASYLLPMLQQDFPLNQCNLGLDSWKTFLQEDW